MHLYPAGDRLGIGWKQGRAMNRWLWIAGALLLVGCANQGYRYEDDGYWTAPRRAPTLIVSVGWGACSGWGGPYGHPYYGYGHGYGVPYGYGWAPCGYGYGYGPGRWYGAGVGYWRDPYWSQPWYLPPRTIGPLPAGARARHMATHPTEDLTGYPRYEDLATSRRRDLGTGGRAPMGADGRRGAYYDPILLPSPQGGIGSGSRGAASPGYPTPPQGLSSGRFDSGSSMSGPSRSSWESRSSASPRSGGPDASPRGSASGAARSLSRESREEE